MKIILTLTVMLLLAANARAAVPGDAAEGKRLHDASCTGCHDSSVYTRKDHKVRSLEGLGKQVENCTHMAQREFAPAEKQDIVKYLNDQFYRFH
jgi:cytochrome c553